MTTELHYLALTALVTALMWLPYGMTQIVDQGLLAAVGNRDDAQPLAPWAERAKRAHENGVANLVVFACLVLIAHVGGVSNAAVATASIVYFWMRIAHYVVYAMGVIFVRTLVWSVAWICQLSVAWQILMA